MTIFRSILKTGCILVALASPALASPVLAAPAVPLTCTVVHGQCIKECGKEAMKLICNRYCSGRKSECLHTGNWAGRYGDVFDNVDRR